MSNAASPAPSDIESRKKEVAFRFCQECSNLLYAKEDRSSNELLYVCRACHAVQKHESACTYRKHYAANVQETAGTITDVASDPTVGVVLPLSICFCTMCGEQLKCFKCGKMEIQELPRAKETCPRCKEPEAVYFQSQQRAADTGMKLYYVCTNCNNTWTTV